MVECTVKNKMLLTDLSIDFLSEFSFISLMWAILTMDPLTCIWLWLYFINSCVSNKIFKKKKSFVCPARSFEGLAPEELQEAYRRSSLGFSGTQWFSQVPRFGPIGLAMALRA